MRVTLLANPDSLHVRRWIEFLAGRGHVLTLITDPFTTARPAQCRVLVPRWNLLTNLLAFGLTPRPFGNDRWKHLHMRPLVRASNPEVVHGFEAFNYGTVTALAGPYPKVLTVWGTDVQRIPDTSRLARRMVTRALRGVDAITANDETMPAYLAGRYGVDPACVHAFAWGVDLDIFRPGLAAGAERWRAQLALPAGAPVIFSPRNFHPYWGADLLLEAIPEVHRRRPEAVFVILRGLGGDGAAFAAARDRLAAAGLASAVRFIERPLAEAELAALFNLSAAFISIPRTDLLAQTILEGWACGCLPILADRPAYRRYARPGENALILTEETAGALAGAVVEALDRAALRQAVRREGPRLMAERANWRVNALAMETVYAAAIAHFRARRGRRG